MAARWSVTSGVWNATSTWADAEDGTAGASVPAGSDNVIIDESHTVTLDRNEECQYLEQKGGSGAESTLALASYTLTINSRNAGNSRVIYIPDSYSNIANSTGTIKLTGSADATHKLVGLDNWADELQNLTIHTSGSNPTYRQESALTVNGDLTITAGGLTTNTANHALTVAGRINIAGGTLTCNSSAVSCAGGVTVTGTLNAPDGSGSLTISGERSNRVIDVTGTFNNNDGTITVTYAGQSQIRWTSSSNPHSLVINHSSADIRLAGNMDTAGSREFEGNVTITAGILSTLDVDGSQNHNLTVEEDVNIASGGTLTGNASAISMRSFTNSGTYNATSGTTTITGEESGGFAWLNYATFNHNNGTVDFNPAPTTHIQESNFYNLTITGSLDTQSITLRDSANNLITVFGDLTVARGRLQSLTTTDEIIIHGNTHVAAIGTCWHDADQATNKITHHGLVTNLGIYKVNDETTVKMNGGIRQLNTLTMD